MCMKTKRKDFIKRLILLVIATVMFFSSIVMSMVSVVYADGANDRSKAYIAMGAERSRSTSLGNGEFTYDEMRIIGIFLSNYYIPWSTQINNTDDAEANDKTKENMIKAMTESLNFDQDMAEGLVNVVFQMSMSSAKPIYVQLTDGDETYFNTGEFSCSWADMVLPLMSKTFWLLDKPVDSVIEYYWKDESGNKHVIESYKYGTDSAFANVLRRIMRNVNTKSGYGSGFIGTSADFAHAGKMENSELEDYLSNFSSEDAMLKACALGQQMYIDCFGNIICDNGVGRAFVVMPACLNPYVFIKDGYSAGDAIPVNNLFNMFLNAEGKLVDGKPSSKDSLTFAKSGGNVNKLWTLGRGSTATNWDLKPWNITSDSGKSYLKAMKSKYKNSEYGLIKDTYFDGSGSEGIYMFREKTDLSGKRNAYETDGTYTTIQDWILFDSIGGFSSDNMPAMYANDYGIFGKDFGPLRSQLPKSFSTGADSDNAFNMMTDENSKCYVGGIFSAYVFGYFRTPGIETGGGGGGSEPESGSESESSSGSSEDSSESESSSSMPEAVAFSESTVNINEEYAEEVSGADGVSAELSDEADAVDLSEEISTSVSAEPLTGGEPSSESASTSEPAPAGEDSDTINDKVAFTFNLEGLPSGGSGTFTVEISDDSLDSWLKSAMRHLLHPTEGMNYVKQWFSKLMNSFLLKTHEDIVGNTSTSNTTGSSRYLGFSGYVTVPNLHDLEWTKKVLDGYESTFVYFVVIMSLVLVGYVFLGSMTIQKSLVYLIIFSICAYLPPLLINATVDYSNKICDAIYGDKFTYWALVQHEAYVSEINAALSQKDSMNYSDFLLAQFETQSDYRSSSSTAVALKWMAPKKDNYLVNFQKEIDDFTSSSSLMKIMSGMINEQVSGESYLSNNDNLYLYRSYTDIGTYANATYNWIHDHGMSSEDISKNTYGVELDSGVKLSDELQSSRYLGNRNWGYTLQYATDKGFNYPTQSNTYSATYNYRITSPFLGKKVSNKIFRNLDNVRLSVKDACGIPQSVFSITVRNLNNGDPKVTYEKYGAFVFGEYSESPFYYFSMNLKDQIGYSESVGSVKLLEEYKYKQLYLQGDGDYFYNNKSDLNGKPGYGELRDFMDMRSLFHCVIPFLKEANDVVRLWDEEYGLFLYDGIDIEYVDEDATNVIPPTADRDTELYYKWWHNLQVLQLFNMYTPWVDKMYDCDYAKPTKITVHGKRYTVEDPLDPYSYYKMDATGNVTEGRFMVFSESEMKYYGLEYSDLTPVEKKIINVQKESYKDLLTIMDYYTFDDDVLNTASAMMETFNFNKEFSQHSLFKDSLVLYPQNYELKNFTYDAYLRLILINNTGEMLQDADDYGRSINLYQLILNHTSFITGVLMIGLDAIAMYVIPIFKLFFLIAVFVLSLLVLVSALLSVKPNIVGVIADSLIKPLLEFLAVSVGMAFAVSLFMSDGNTAVTNRGGFTVALGDPTMTIIAMLAINVFVVVLYWKICKKTFNDCKKYIEAVLATIAGLATGVLNKVTATVTGVKSGVDGFARGIGRTASGIAHARNRGLENKANRAELGRGFSKAARQKKTELKANKSDSKPSMSTNRQNSVNSKIAQGKKKITMQEKQHNGLGSKSAVTSSKKAQSGFLSARRKVKDSGTAYGGKSKAVDSTISKRTSKPVSKSNKVNKRTSGTSETSSGFSKRASKITSKSNRTGRRNSKNLK